MSRFNEPRWNVARFPFGKRLFFNMNYPPAKAGGFPPKQ